MITEVLAAAVGTVAFALLFGVPRKYYAYCGLIGGVGWGVYRFLVDFCTVVEANFAAAIAVVFLSRLFAVRKRCPVTIFLISGIFSLVPGAGIYWAAYYLVINDLERAAATGYQAIKIAAAIVLGIVLVFELPQNIFRSRKRRAERKKRDTN